MTQPASNDPSSKQVVVPKATRKDILTGIVIAVLVIGFIVFAIIQTSRPPLGNKLSGTIVDKLHTGTKEEEITLGFQHGNLDHKTTDTGYHLIIKVENREEPYVVPVRKETWESKKVGETFEFIRPPEEQRLGG